MLCTFCLKIDNQVDILNICASYFLVLKEIIKLGVAFFVVLRDSSCAMQIVHFKLKVLHVLIDCVFWRHFGLVMIFTQGPCFSFWCVSSFSTPLRAVILFYKKSSSSEFWILFIGK